MTGKTSGTSIRHAAKHVKEPKNGKAFGREVAASFWAIGADVARLALAFGAWKVIDWLLLQLFGDRPADDAKVFSSIAHWGTMLTIVGPRFMTVLTEMLALVLRFARTFSAGAHGIWMALTTGKVDPDDE